MLHIEFYTKTVERSDHEMERSYHGMKWPLNPDPPLPHYTHLPLVSLQLSAEDTYPLGGGGGGIGIKMEHP